MFFFSSRRRHTRCALVTGVQTCALPICSGPFSVTFTKVASGSLSPVWIVMVGILSLEGILVAPTSGAPVATSRMRGREGHSGGRLVAGCSCSVFNSCGSSSPQDGALFDERSEEHTSELTYLKRLSYA